MARTQNTADLPQALNSKKATLIENYFIERDFQLTRRNGSRTVATEAGSSPSKILSRWTDTLMILGYGTTLAVFNLNNNALHTIKSDFSQNLTDGVAYGNNFYSCNGKHGDPIYQTTLPTLAYDVETSPFTVGQTVTGATSGATATIISIADSSPTGTLTLDNITAEFIDDEIITDPLGGSATSNGTIVYTNTAAINPTISLYYTSLTVNFTVGETVTGGSSGATGVVVAQLSLTATSGILQLKSTVGTFTNAETVTGGVAGSATVTLGTNQTKTMLGFVPKCEFLYILGTRLTAGNTDTSSYDVHLSGDNDPTQWDTSQALIGFSYSISDQRFGNVNSVGTLNLGTVTYSEYKSLNAAFFDHGILGWRVTQQTVGSDLLQQVSFEIEDFTHGGYRGALSTQHGIFYGNSTGEYILHADGQSVNLSWNFGRQVISQLNALNADRVYQPEKYLVYITTSKSSATNNIIYWFDIRTVKDENVLWGTVTGIPTNRFCLMGSQLYGASAVSPSIVEMFPNNVWDDDGCNVFYHYRQPLNINGMQSINDLQEQYIAGFLSPNNPLTVAFDGYTEQGYIQNTGISYQWGTAGAPGMLVGLGEMELGKDQFGDTPQPGGTVWTPATGYNKAYGYNSYILDISGNDQAPHVVSYFEADIRRIRNQRKNLLTMN